MRKEWRTEFRNPSILLAGLLFSLGSMMAISLAAFSTKLSGTLGAGLYWVALLFASLLTAPRRFTNEEEQRTGDLLRLVARPHSVFWGKALWVLAELAANAIVLAGTFLLFTGQNVAQPGIFAVGLFGTVLALAGATSVSGAMASRARQSTGLAATLALPLLLPIIFLGMAALRTGLGDGVVENGWRSAVGLVGYGIASLAVGPYLFAAVWKR